MDEDTPCGDCISAAEHNVFKDTQISDGNPPLITSAILPTESLNGLEVDTGISTASLNREGPNAQAPPLTGTVILRV